MSRSKVKTMVKKAYRNIVPADIQRAVAENRNIIYYRRNVDNFIADFYARSTPPIFRDIEIETINRCNGTCSFCPVNVNEPQRPYAKMTEELFQKIITELKDLQYDGRVALFSNNEPFLDDRMDAWLKYTRTELPNAYIGMFTNGSLLTVERFAGIIDYIDHLTIDNYSENNTVNSNLVSIKEYIESHPKLQSRVFFSMRKKDEIITSRGGQAPNKRDVRGIKAACYYPFGQMSVRPDGKVALCCNDALVKCVMGDVAKQSLTEIWYGEKFTAVREEMRKNYRKNLENCRHCDVHYGLYGA